LCQADEDWYQFNAPSNTTLDIILVGQRWQTPPYPSPQIWMELYLLVDGSLQQICYDQNFGHSSLCYSLNRNLVDAGTYAIEVRYVEPDSDSTAYSLEWLYDFPPISDLQLFYAGSNLQLYWSPVPEAVGYYLYFSETAYGPWALISTLTETLYTLPYESGSGFFQVTWEDENLGQ
jgi:hypothetical protein